MDFLYKLYSNENFGIILFVIISILVLAFLIILFFGKKDQKERELAETKKIEIKEDPLSETLFEETQEGESLEIVEEKEQPIPIAEEVGTNFVTPNLVLNSDLINETFSDFSVPVPEMVEDSHVDTTENTMMEKDNELPKMDFDFDALAASISKELESMGANFDVSENVTDEEVVEEPKSMFELPKQEVKIDKDFLDETTYESEVKRNPSPTQFSSVFVGKRTPEEIKPVVLESVKVQPMPVKPSFELPKPIDLPKLTSDATPIATPVIEEEIQNDLFRI